MTRQEAIEAAEKENFTYEFADYWVDIYLDTRCNEATILNFLNFLQTKKPYKEGE